MFDFIVQADKELFLFLNSCHTEVLDHIMWLFSGKWFWIPLYLSILVWWIFKQKWNAVWLFLLAIVALIASDQISVAIKFALERPRPSHNPEFAGLVHHINNYKGGAYGFVSSHAANTFGFGTYALLSIKKRWFTIAIMLWAAVVSYSRIYLGVHYPGDIIVGALLGFGIGYTCFILSRITIKTWPIKTRQTKSW